MEIILSILETERSIKQVQQINQQLKILSGDQIVMVIGDQLAIIQITSSMSFLSLIDTLLMQS